MGDRMGKITRQKVWRREAPSIWAASTISSGIFCRPARKKTMLNPSIFQAAARMITNKA